MKHISRQVLLLFFFIIAYVGLPHLVSLTELGSINWSLIQIGWLTLMAYWSGSILKALGLSRETGYILMVSVFYAFGMTESIQLNPIIIISIAAAASGFIVFYRAATAYKLVQYMQSPFSFVRLPATLGLLIFTLLIVLSAILPDTQLPIIILVGAGIFLMTSFDDVEHNNPVHQSHLLPFKLKYWLIALLILFSLNWIETGNYTDAAYILINLIVGMLFGRLLTKYEIKISDNILSIFSIGILGILAIHLSLGLPVLYIVFFLLVTGMSYGLTTKLENLYVRELIYPVTVAQIQLFILPLIMYDLVFDWWWMAVGAGLFVIHTLAGLGLLYLANMNAPGFLDDIKNEFIHEALLISPVSLILVLSVLAVPQIPTDLVNIVIGSVMFLFLLNRLISPVILRILFKKAVPIEDSETELASPRAQKEKSSEELIWSYSDLDPVLTKEIDQLVTRLSDLQSDVMEFNLKDQYEEISTYIYTFQETVIDSLLQIKTLITGKIKESGIESVKTMVREERGRLYHWFSDISIRTANQHLYKDKNQGLFSDLFSEIDVATSRLTPFIAVPFSQYLLESSPQDNWGNRLMKQMYRFRNQLHKIIQRETMTRTVPYRDIVRYQFSGLFVQRAEKVVNLFHSQGWYTISESIKIFKRFDMLYNDLLKFLDSLETSEDVEKDVNAFFIQLNTNISEYMQVMSEDLENYNREIEINLKTLFNQSVNQCLKQLRVAGTMWLPGKAYQFNQIAGSRRRAIERYNKSNETWSSYALGEASAYGLELDIALLQSNLRKVINQATVDFNNFIRSRLELPLENIKKRLLQSRKQLSTLLEKRDEDLNMAEFAEEEIQGFNNIFDRQIKRIDNAIRHNESQKIQLKYFREIEELVKALPEAYDIIDNRNLELKEWLTPEIPTVVTAKVRETARQFLQTDLTRNLNEDARRIDQLIEAALTLVIEYQKIITFNLETVTQSIRQEPKNIILHKDLVKQQLIPLIDRLQVRLSEYLDDIHISKDQVTDHVVTESIEKSRVLRDIIKQKSILDYKKESRPDEPSMDDFRLLNRLERTLAYWSHRLKLFYKRRFGAMTNEMLEDIQQAFHISDLDGVTLNDLRKHIAAFQNHYQQLPLIYRRLFNFEAIETDDLMVGRDDELHLIEETYEQWKNGQTGSVAIIGNLGSGKSSLISILIRRATFGSSVYRKKFQYTVTDEKELVHELAVMFNLPEHLDSLPNLKFALHAMEIRPVVMIEGLHKFFLRSAGEMEALKKLLAFIVETSHFIFWIVTINKQAWHFLNTAIQIDRYFGVAIDLRPFQPADIRRSLLNRQQLTGYQLRIHQTEWQKFKFNLANIFYFTVKLKEQRLKRLFMNRLTELSGGSINTAIFLWLSSIKSITNHEIFLTLPDLPDFEVMNKLSDFQKFILGHIVMHGGLSASGLARIMNTSTGLMANQLDILTHLGFVTSTMVKGEFYFMINRGIYEQLSNRLLQNRILI